MEPIIFLSIITGLLITNVVYAFKTETNIKEVERKFDQLHSRLNRITLAEKRLKNLEKEKAQKPKQHIRNVNNLQELDQKSRQSHTIKQEGFTWPNNDTGV